MVLGCIYILSNGISQILSIVDVFTLLEIDRNRTRPPFVSLCFYFFHKRREKVCVGGSSP